MTCLCKFTLLTSPCLLCRLIPNDDICVVSYFFDYDVISRLPEQTRATLAGGEVLCYYALLPHCKLCGRTCSMACQVQDDLTHTVQKHSWLQFTVSQFRD
jgi:hypothetical protein